MYIKLRRMYSRLYFGEKQKKKSALDQSIEIKTNALCKTSRKMIFRMKVCVLCKVKRMCSCTQKPIDFISQTLPSFCATSFFQSHRSCKEESFWSHSQKLLIEEVSLLDLPLELLFLKQLRYKLGLVLKTSDVVSTIELNFSENSYFVAMSS